MTYQKARLYNFAFFKGVFGYHLNFELYRFKNGDMFNYHEKSEERAFSEYLLKKVLNRSFAVRNFNNLEKKINRLFNEYFSFIKSLPKNPSKLTNKEICRILEKYYKKENKLSETFWILFGSVEVVLIKAVQELLLSEKISQKESERIIAELSEPMKITPIDAEKISLLQVALKNGLDRQRLLLRHVQKFACIPMYDVDHSPYTAEYFQENLNKIAGRSKEEIKKEIDDVNNKYSLRSKRALKIINQFKKNQHLFYLLKFFSAYSYLKDCKPFARDTGNFNIRRIFQEVSTRLGLTLTETLFLNEKEIPGLLNKGLKISKDTIQSRINNSAYFYRRGEVQIITAGETLQKVDEILAKKEDVREIKGLGVSSGLAIGKVFIILSNNDFSKFEDGGILVTSATRPDFVPVMKKAKAIVADEGGILSHAAIVSRELKKPCIVGTGDGTHALKDGDLVEVDADKGIIKILKRK
jgi:phosphoenolpyruvate synthase/pyruvate phosphate dikinase